MLDKEFKYFLDHRDELVKKHGGKYLVIKDKEVIGVYDREIDAYFKTQEKHELGTFLIQYCTADQEAYTQNFTSRAIFV